MTAAVLDMTEPIESRVVRLESDVAYLCSVITDLRMDLRQMRSDASTLAATTYGRFTALHRELCDSLNEVRREMRNKL